MKNTSLFIVLVFVISSSGYCQNTAFSKDTAFDFWVGSWEVCWYGKDSTKITGTNIIEKILDGKVIQEKFIDPSSDFKGTSISVYNPNEAQWHQAWADNRGGYFDFIGEVSEDVRIFKTQQPDKKGILYRMIFSNITKDAFIWEWQSIKEGENEWTTTWHIDYKRK